MTRIMRYSTPTTNEQSSLVSTLLDGGRLRIYTDPVPDSADHSPADADLLLELQFDSPAFDAPVGGIITAHPLPPGYAMTTGRATWYRDLQQDGTTVFDGTVGLASDNPNLVLDQVDLQQGALVTIQGFQYTSPQQ